jgi:FMN-dependent NADH-azoreductase
MGGQDVPLYRLDASIRVEGSHSRAVAEIVEQEWRNARPGEPVIRRHVGVDPIPATAWATAVFAGRTPGESRTGEQQAALALAATLTDELIAADALLFAASLYNFGVSQHFKTWVDVVCTRRPKSRPAATVVRSVPPRQLPRERPPEACVRSPSPGPDGAPP